MTRTACERCGLFMANAHDWETVKPGEDAPDAGPDGLCWEPGVCEARTVPARRIERWIRRLDLGLKKKPDHVLAAILRGEEPPE